MCSCVCIHQACKVGLGRAAKVLWRLRLVNSGCCTKNIMGWVTYEQKCLSHISRGWEVHDRETCRFCVWWGTTSSFVDDHLLSVSSQGRRGKVALWAVFYKSTNLLPKALPPNTIIWGLVFNIWIWLGNTFSLQQVLEHFSLKIKVKVHSLKHLTHRLREKNYSTLIGVEVTKIPV